jgi:hypothetical protein
MCSIAIAIGYMDRSSVSISNFEIRKEFGISATQSGFLQSIGRFHLPRKLHLLLVWSAPAFFHRPSCELSSAYRSLDLVPDVTSISFHCRDVDWKVKRIIASELQIAANRLNEK